MLRKQTTNLPTKQHLQTQSLVELFQQPYLIFIISVMSASTVVAYFFRNTATKIELISWLAMMYLGIFFRLSLVLFYRQKIRTSDETHRWGRMYLLLTALNGILWGLPAFYLNADNETLTFLYALIISGLIAGSVPILSYSFPVYLSFVLTAGTPFIIQLSRLQHQFYWVLDGLAMMFLITNITSAYTSQKKIHQRIRLEFENRALVENLIEAKENAESANLVKTKFLAAASHDLRQPLHALGLFVDVLDARIKFPEVRRIVDKIKLSTSSLNGLLTAILDISKLDAEVIKPDIKDFQLTILLQQLAQEFRPQAIQEGLTLRVHGCASRVRSDPIMLARILRNLLTNAIRYTEAGGVLIGCRRRQGHVRIEVYDTGEGIPSEQCHQIFEEFYQVNNPERDRNKGLGLGLAIVKRLVDLLGHRIQVRSCLHKGSRFAVTVPTAKIKHQEAKASPHQRERFDGAFIVVIDDEATIREGMGELLHSWDCRALLADSVEHALQQLTDAGEEPVLIIADYRLREGKTGVEAIRQIDASLGAKTPAIIVTGDIDPQRLREAQASGYQLLHKPVSTTALRDLMSDLLAGRVASQASTLS